MSHSPALDDKRPDAILLWDAKSGQWLAYKENN